MSETEAQTTKKDDYIVQGSILAAAAVLTKMICLSGLCNRSDDFIIQPSNCRIQAGIDPTCKASETKCIPCIYLFTCFCNRCWIIHLADNLFGSRTDFNTFNEIST